MNIYVKVNVNVKVTMNVHVTMNVNVNKSSYFFPVLLLLLSCSVFPFIYFLYFPSDSFGVPIS